MRNGDRFIAGECPGAGRGMSRLAAEVVGTGRLDLEPLRVDHAEEMARVLADPALHTFIGGVPDTPQALRSRYECLTGTVQATVSTTGQGLIAEIAWVVGSVWQGRGIATEAARGLVGRLARQPVRSVIAHIHPEHHASAAVALAAGLTPTGRWHDGELRRQRSFSRVPTPG